MNEENFILSIVVIAWAFMSLVILGDIAITLIKIHETLKEKK